ncbi:MAG: Holliday junction branch migration protein RuvA [Chloroflexi bacterium]|nr:Holliday junction branch migration protein RuvA [Chloroflexota bacterium]
MIAAVRGTLGACHAEYAQIDIGGIGLRVFAAPATLAGLGPVGSSVHLHTYLYLRDDVITLYGFARSDERDLFERLLTVSGVGPRIALGLLAHLSPEALRSAIAQGDSEALSKVPGVGRKVAGRIILEMKGKWPPAAQPTPQSSADEELVAALVNLGYTLVQARLALNDAAPDPSLNAEERILAALRHLARP